MAVWTLEKNKIDVMCKVSVIVPVYNVELYIERCARSLFEQSLEDIEIIFVDDRSPDRSIAVVKDLLVKYPHRASSVIFAEHKKNKGLTNARNTGLSLASGEFIIHCDSDDWMDTSMLQKMYDSAIREGADIVYCDFYMYYKDRQEQYHNLPAIHDRASFIRKYLLELTVLWNFMAKKELYDRYDLKSPEHITYCEDLHLAMKLYYYAGNICKVDEPLYYYNRANVSSLLNSVSIKAMQDNITALTEVADFFMKEGVFVNFEKELAWRVLKIKQDLVLDKSTHNKFMSILPWAHSHIISNPMIKSKMKFMMWCLVHRMPWVTSAIVKLRNRLGR